MRQFKKRTLALVLASMVTVVGAFGGEYFKNSLMSVKFERSSEGINLTLLTKERYENNINLSKRDAYTYVIMLPGVKSEIAGRIETSSGISSVDVKTMPYTTENNGYTKLTVKTVDNIPLNVHSAIYLPPPKTQEPLLETSQPEFQDYELNQARDRTEELERQLLEERKRNNDIHSTTGVSQTAPVDIKNSVKQFQTTPQNFETENNITEPTAEENSIQDNQPQKSDFSLKAILNTVLGVSLIIFLIGYFFFRAKGKMTEILGETTNYNLDDEPDEKKIETKKRKKINNAIKNLDKKYTQPVTMQVNAPKVTESIPEENFENIVDLDELFNNQAESGETDDSFEENSALDDFLKDFNFDEYVEEHTPQVQEIEEDSFDEEFYQKCIASVNLRFTNDDIDKINTLLNSELSGDAYKYAPKTVVTDPNKRTQSRKEMLEKFVMLYTIQHNISFTGEDVQALDKLMNVEIDNDFITDLHTNKESMLKMQEEIEKQKSRPHKASELLILNVKDMLPDLSLALKKQGNKRIESEVTPDVVYFSEGYDVEILKQDIDLPDLAQEINNKEAYVSRPSDNMLFVDNSYEVETLSIKDELPDLTDFSEHPDKYDNEPKKPEKVDEKALFESIANVQFKPFYDGSESNIINEFDNETETQDTPEVEEPKAEEPVFEIPKLQEPELETPKTEEPKVEKIQNLPVKPKPAIVKKERYNKTAEELLELIKDKQENKKETKEEAQKASGAVEAKIEKRNSIPEFFVLDGEKLYIAGLTNITENIGCYLTKNNNGYSIIEYNNDKIKKIKSYETLKNEKIQARVSETLDDGTVRYIIKAGEHKFIINVKDDQIEFVMDLC